MSASLLPAQTSVREPQPELPCTCRAVIGVHVAQPVERPARAGDPPLSPAEVAYHERDKIWDQDEGGYQAIQSSKPQTLAFALADSPAGLASWILEKFKGWSDCGGDPTSVSPAADARRQSDHLLDDEHNRFVGPLLLRCSKASTSPPGQRLCASSNRDRDVAEGYRRCAQRTRRAPVQC